MEEFKDFNGTPANDQVPQEETNETVTEHPEQEEVPVSEPVKNIENDDAIVEESFENEESEQPKTQIEEPYRQPYSPINYTKVVAMENTKPMSRGLKFFALLLALVIALTAACAGGYYLGKISVSKSFSGGEAVVGLEAKPKNTNEMTAAQVYEKVNASVVGIYVYNAAGKMANASGVIYSSDGYIITNDHIYSEIGSPKFKIYTYDNKEYDAQYIAGDKVSDLAILKIKDGDFKTAVFGNSNQIIFGENVVAIGRPGGATNASSVTKGIVSATSRRVQTTSSYSARLIETDCPINPGSSGGVLANMYGQVVGITSSKLASSDIDAVGYAIPTTTVKRIAEELIKNGKVLSRAKLGITYRAIDSVMAEIEGYKYKGLYVDSVSEDSDLLGKITKGDIITHINGIEVTRDEIVLDIIEKSKAGDNIQVTFVNSNGKSKTIQAKLKANVGETSYFTAEQPNNNGTLPQLPNDSEGNGGAFNFPFGE